MKKVAVICSDKIEYGQLKRSRHAKDCNFILIGKESEVWQFGFSMRSFIEEEFRYLKRLKPDAIIGTDDYPACPLSALFADELGLISPSLKSILLCQHKYRSRQIQKKVLPNETPSFGYINIDGKSPINTLQFPFFIKPVKHYLSCLAEKVSDSGGLHAYMKKGRRTIPTFVRHMEQMLPNNDENLKGFNWRQFITEEIMHGKQATLEGFVSNNRFETIGIVDSIRYPNKFSFKRFQYPSKLPEEAQVKMVQLSRKIMKAIGFNNSIFNIEFFYDEKTGKVSIIEINPRMATQFSNLYGAVDGTNSYDLQLDLALGHEPQFEKGKGKFKVAASFVPRYFQDKLIISAPKKRQLQKVEEAFPESSTEIYIKQGKRLSQAIQDGRSFRYLIINLGGKSEKDLFRKYGNALRMLPFKFKGL